ncbi:hypothetical protein L226DRAFT_572563 [Lentinus tigrinus ALCF2SS1-7]|uniref:Fungal-type protein kinase domain-containing protein n=1 Tax=Lentinus tigrinus ALCF2SS1-6 TaxID=1328759 RepID=A0A5C2S327_9APHY|nr:hypothetical protein L227DRAFT_613838 [Lentinus tigrinus ALCF2SS1-6]RPD73120.1 hypothetical protein L226DRAFT_572563 [Lentinus tigrinus ALCF2SS1-7]
MADKEPPTHSAENSASHLSEDLASAAPSPPPSPSQVHLEGAPTTSTASPPIADDAAPDSAAAAPVKDDLQDEVDPYNFYNTLLKDNPLPFSYDPTTDKQRGPWLINKSGMGPRFRELPIEQFLKLVNKTGPTDDERKKFTKVDLTGVKVEKMKEKDWYPYMNATANSVFDAIDESKLVWLDTSTHKAPEPAVKGEKKPRTGTFNDAGVYWDSTAARLGTTLTERQRKTSKLTPKEMAARGKVGGRSWHWVAVPVEIKNTVQKSAFIFDDWKKQAPAPSEAAHPDCSATVVDEGSPATDSSASSRLPGQQRTEGHTQASDARRSKAEDDHIKRLIPPTIYGEAALAQFAEYMLNVLNYQHRVFCYAIYATRHMARLCCIDRGAIIVSTQFDWLNTDSPLHDFLWMVGHMSPEGLGYDPTAVLVEDEDKEAQLFKDMAKNSSVRPEIRKYVLAATAPGVPIYRISITPMAAPDDEKLPEDPSSQSKKSATSPPPDPSSASPPPPPAEPTDRYFLVGKPHFMTDSLVGRCTRGYVAYDLSTGNLCFIKDYWRPYVPGRSRPEHLVYERLQSSQVEGVATLICGGDVGGLRAQRTQFHTLLSHVKALPVTRIHYRLGTKEIGLPLEEFKNFRELSMVFYDAITAHFEAWTKAKVLHRDISVGNILIDPVTRKGILIDWDLCRLEWELGMGPTEPDRTGTWEFRSALLLQYPRKPHRLSDDLEAFIHTFRYLVLKYHVTDIPGMLKPFVKSMFEETGRVRGIKIGGNTKLDQFRHSAESPIRVENNPVLQAILEDFQTGCHLSYRQLDLEKMKALYGVFDPKLQASAPTVDVAEILPFRKRIPIPGGKGVHGSSTGAKEPSRGHGNKASVGERDAGSGHSEASEPCAVPGFLSHHGYLTDVLDRYQWPANRSVTRQDKARLNQFLFRGKVLDQDTQEDTPRISSRGISDMSVSSNADDVVPSNLYPSPSSALADLRSFLLSGTPRSGKRTRDEEEESGDGEMVDASNDSEDSYTDEEEGDPDAICEQKHKRPRL